MSWYMPGKRMMLADALSPAPRCDMLVNSTAEDVGKHVNMVAASLPASSAAESVPSYPERLGVLLRTGCGWDKTGSSSLCPCFRDVVEWRNATEEQEEHFTEEMMQKCEIWNHCKQTRVNAASRHAVSCFFKTSLYYLDAFFSFTISLWI